MLRLQLRPHVIELQFRAQMPGGGVTVAGQHHRVQTFIAQLRHDVGRLRADVITQNNPADQVVTRDPDFGKPRFRGGHRGNQLRPFARREPFAAAQQAVSAVVPGFQSLAGDGFKL